MEIFERIIVRIITEQERIIGPLAWSEAGKVTGITVVDRVRVEISISHPDPKDVVDRLVAQYERLFGRASQEVCKDAVASILAELPPAEIPNSLRVA